MTTDPLSNPPASVLAFLSDRARHDDSGSLIFVDDKGETILDLDREGCPPADARAAAWWAYRYKPEVFVQAAETKPSTPASIAPATSSAADIMARVRAGDLTAAEASARILAIGAPATVTTPSKAAAATDARAPAPTVSDLMGAVRRGVPGAQARLDAHVKGMMR